MAPFGTALCSGSATHNTVAPLFIEATETRLGGSAGSLHYSDATALELEPAGALPNGAIDEEPRFSNATNLLKKPC